MAHISVASAAPESRYKNAKPLRPHPRPSESESALSQDPPEKQCLRSPLKVSSYFMDSQLPEVVSFISVPWFFLLRREELIPNSETFKKLTGSLIHFPSKRQLFKATENSHVHPSGYPLQLNKKEGPVVHNSLVKRL